MQVNSSMIETINYDRIGRLIVKFKSTKKEFIFLDVPESIFLDLCTCADIGDSVGSRFNALVKGKFKFLPREEFEHVVQSRSDSR